MISLHITSWTEDSKEDMPDRTLFVKTDEKYLLVAQVYVDDIVFGATTDA